MQEAKDLFLMDKGKEVVMSRIDLGTVVNIRTGKLDANACCENGKFPFFTCSREPLRIDSYTYDCECILVAGNGDLNVKYYNGKFDAYQRTYIIEAKDNNSLLVRYLYYFIDSKMGFIRSQSIGGVIKYIKLGDLTSLMLPIPTFNRQQEIAAILDKASDLVEKRKAQLAELDTLAESIFYDMFGDPVTNEKGWEKKKLFEVCSDIVDCPHSTPIKSARVTQYPCIRTSELKQGSISWESMQYVEHEEYTKRVQRLIPINGDIVYGREGSYGDAVIIPDKDFFCLGQRTMLFRPNYLIINSQFLHRMIISDYLYIQAKRKNAGSTVGHVNVKDVKLFTVLLPPLSLQQQFAQRIEKIESQKQKVKAALKESEELFQRLMQDMFNPNSI